MRALGGEANRATLRRQVGSGNFVNMLSSVCVPDAVNGEDGRHRAAAAYYVHLLPLPRDDRRRHVFARRCDSLAIADFNAGRVRRLARSTSSGTWLAQRSAGIPAQHKEK